LAASATAGLFSVVTAKPPVAIATAAPVIAIARFTVDRILFPIPWL
jgi:hypothetical protein